MYHLRKIKVLLVTCLLACSSLWAQDTEITISGATASSSHNDAHRAENAIDGKFETIWHSNWNNIPKFPVDFVITLKEVSHVDYVRYTPRLSGTNGNWKKVDVSYSTSTSGSSFTSPVTYDLKGASSTFDFPIGANCGQIKFTIYPGETDNGKNLASAAEIAAYAYDTAKPAAFAEYFNGDVYSELKPGVTSSDGIADADVKALVDAMLADAEGYKKFRVGEYEPYMTTATVRNNLKTNALYNNYENPTGIYLKRGESCIIAVSGIGNYPVGLKIKDWYKSGDLSTYKLHNGLNYITATTEGNVFVDYYTDDFEQAPNVQMHFINAPVLGYWDQATMTNADWESMLRGPLAEDDVIIITRSQHAQTAYPVKQWKTYCPTDVNSTMTYYQQVQWAERDILGLEMFGRQVKNRQLFYADKSGSMFAGGDASVCGYGDLKPLVTPDAKVFDFWGVGHEWGHNNQMAGFHWTGCGETTNNIPASWAQFKFTGNRDANGNPTNLRLEDEVTGINDYKGMRGGRMQTYFEEGLRKGVQWQLQDGPDWHAETPTAVTVTGRDENGNDKGQVNTTWRHYDHFVKLAPFWQLNLWGTVAEKNPYIITKVIEAIRSTDNYTSTYNTNGKQQINWMKLACQAAEMDLLPFFEKAGMLRPIHAYVDDYAKGWNIITEGMINELKASVADEVAAGRYQAYPDEEINYINGHNYHIYRDKLELNVTSMEGERNGDKVTIQHSVAQNAVAFETYNAQDELIRITMYGLGSDDTHSYTQVLFPSSFDESENAAYIMAVGYDGERQRVYQTYANEDEAKYGELGRILAGVEAMKALCNDTKVGYYKSSALTDLNAAYTTAKRVYDNKESASYAAIYDMLNAEYGKVLNDEYARVGIVEGNAYRLTNKNYPGRSLSIPTDSVNKQMMGEITDTESPYDQQLWYFEASETEGSYYLKNKNTSTYPGNVETSTFIYATATSTSDAHAYKLRDMGNGLWALEGNTALHLGAANYKYGVLGWGADATASQWYITAVEISSNAEALHDLRSLIAKTEALIAEVEGDAAYSSISTALSQTKSQVTTAKAALEAGNSSAYDALNEAYKDLLAAKKNVDDSVLDVLKNQLSTLIGNANSLIAQCGAVTYTPATPDTELALQANYPANSWYVSSNADENTGGGKVDGGGIAALVDNNYNTYFHTRWDGTEVNEPHNIQVDMGEGKTIQEFVFSYTPRNGSPAPTAMTIYGSNDASSFTDVLATITSGLPAHNSGNSYTSSAINSGGATYRYLRFVVTKSAGPAANTQYGGQYFFGMMEFDITEMAKPESYTVTLGNDRGDVTKELLLTAFKAVQEAQSVVDYANTEAQVNEAIEKLQAQYQALEEAKNAAIDFTISSNIAGGGVTFEGGEPCVGGGTLSVPASLTLDELKAKLAAIDVNGYVAQPITINENVISIIYNKVYSVQVVGVEPANGGVKLGETTYAGGATFNILESSFDINNFTAIPVTGYAAYKTFEGSTITVTYKKIYTVNVVGIEGQGGVKYGEGEYMMHGQEIHVLGTLETNQLTASTVTGYKAYVTIVDATIIVTYNKVYIINVTGGRGNGGVTYNGTTYANGATFDVLESSFDENLLEAYTPAGYTLKGDITVDDNGIISVAFTAKPLVDTEKFYTLECLSEYAHSTERFISDNGTVINGCSAEGSLFQFEAADEDNGYYIKSYVSDKYLNCTANENTGNDAVVESEEKSTVWKMAKHTEGVVTLTAGHDKYLNNNGDAPTYLLARYHDGGPASSNACSLWTLTEGTPLDKSALNTLIGETNTLIEACYTDEEFNYAGSLNVTEELMTATREAVAAAQEKYDSKATTESEYEAALTALQTVKDNLQTAIAYATLPVKLTYDANSPVTYKIAIARSDLSVLAYDESSAMVAVSDFKLGNKAHGWYFMPATDGKVYIMPYYDDNTTLALSTNSFEAGNSKVKGMAVGSNGYTQGWTITNANLNDDNRENGWYNITCTSNGTDTWYFSNHGGVANKMGFLNDANDGGSRFKFEQITFDKSEAYYTLYNYYMSDTKVASNTITGNDAVGYYPVDAADAYNTAYGTAKTVLEDATATDEDYTNAYNALVAANEALEINMPEEGKYYTIVSACSDLRNGQLMYATSENAIVFSREMTNVKPEALWKFTAEGYLENLQTGCGVSTGSTGGSHHKLGESPRVVSIKSISLDGQVLLIPQDAHPLHAQDNGSVVVGWGDYDAGSASAWRIVEVEPSLANVKFDMTIGQYGHAGLYLNYSVLIPAAVKAYIIDGSDVEIKNGEGSLTLKQIEGSVLPAKTAVILEAEPNSYSFYYTENEANVGTNLLTGSAYQTYREAETNHNYYIFGQKDDVVGLYKNSVVYDATGAEGDTHYKMSANKVLFDWDNSAGNVNAFRFRIDGEETGIEEVTVGAEDTIYDLYGRRVLEVVTPGLYIVNGEKRYVKVK